MVTGMEERKDIEKNGQDNSLPDKFMMRMDLADILRLSMLGTLVTLSTVLFRLPIGLPGHSSVYWMGLLILGKGLLPGMGSGAVMGLVSGVLAVMFGMGKGGLLVFFKYFAPGLVLDIVSILFMYRFNSIIVCGIIGAIISISKLLADLALGFLFHLPMGFIKAGLIYASVLHLVFGFIGGIAAWALIKRLKPRIKQVRQ